MIEVLGPVDPEGDATGATIHVKVGEFARPVMRVIATITSAIFQNVQRALRFVRSEKYPNEYVQEAQQLGLRGQ